jgi:hypothetical protein
MAKEQAHNPFLADSAVKNIQGTAFSRINLPLRRLLPY